MARTTLNQKNAKAVLALLILLAFFSSPVFSRISSQSSDDYDIYQSARSISDCERIDPSSIWSSSCYEQFAKNGQNCTAFPLKYQKECLIAANYIANSSNIGSCEGLLQDYRQDCYNYYMLHQSPKRIENCDTLPAQYAEGCQKELIRYVVPGNASESYCQTMEPKYQQTCKDWISTKENSWKIFGGLCLGVPALIVIVFVLLLAAIIYFIRSRK